MRWYAVDFVIRSHNAHRTGFTDSGLKWKQKDLAKNPFRYIHRRAICARLGLTVCREVLQRCHHMLLLRERAVALKALDRGDAHSRNKIRVLAKRFLHAAPTRLAGDIYDGRERLMHAAQTSLVRGHRVQLAYEFGIECGR